VKQAAGRLMQVTLVERYDAAVRHLLSTPYGSLWYAPDYGSMVYTLRTQGITRGDFSRLAEVLARLRQAAQKYIPDILIVDLLAEMDENDQKLLIKGVWVIREATPLMHGELASQQTTTVLL
jgi:phage baseplate assembly protein W